MYGMMQLQRKVKIEKFFGGANHKQNKEERELGISNEELTYGKKPLVITEVPEEFKQEMKAAAAKEAASVAKEAGAKETANTQTPSPITKEEEAAK
jgi:NADH-quinone oxidoreductase subunit B